MTQTLEIINIAVLVIIITYTFNRLIKSYTAQKKKKQDDAETQRWERGAQIASNDKEYDPHQWYFKMPDSALKHLEACFEGDERKVYTMKRAIELSIEHFAIEMADDAECARIIEERVYSNPKPAETFDSEEYKQYRQEREDNEGEFESFSQWKGRIQENGENIL